MNLKGRLAGAPDYILTKKDIPIGFIEAKDIGDKDLDGVKKTGNKEQFDRYKSSLNNLIFTDDGDSIVLMDPVYQMGRVYINDTQFFQMVPLAAWDFYIGVYSLLRNGSRIEKEES